jgi:hypothetical protein
MASPTTPHVAPPLTDLEMQRVLDAAAFNHQVALTAVGLLALFALRELSNAFYRIGLDAQAGAIVAIVVNLTICLAGWIVLRRERACARLASLHRRRQLVPGSEEHAVVERLRRDGRKVAVLGLR